MVLRHAPRTATILPTLRTLPKDAISTIIDKRAMQFSAHVRFTATTSQARASWAHEDPHPSLLDQRGNALSGNQQRSRDPSVLLCPLSGKELVDPVVASDGYTYERSNLERIFKYSKEPRSPITNEVLDPKIMVPNLAVKALATKRTTSSADLVVSLRTLTTINPQEQKEPFRGANLNASPREGLLRDDILSLVDREPFQGRISSDLSELDRLHEKYGWIPGSGQIRPTPETLARKAIYFAEVIPQYESEKDFILHTIFGLPLIDEARRKSDDRLAVLHPSYVLRPHSLRVTKPNMFPYNVPHETLHFVHWIYPHFDEEASLEEDETNRCIRSQLEAYFGPRTVFEFVWDINPKMSLPHNKTCCMHIHVFARVIKSV